jgi:hypothetical protein
MVIDIDLLRWEFSSNRLSSETPFRWKKSAIKGQVDAQLKLGVIEQSRAAHWTQVDPVLKSPGKCDLL